MKAVVSSKSLAAVARLAGVSTMTVSRALRNSPLVSARTKKLVEAAQIKIGYIPDPRITRLMAIVRAKKTRHTQAVLGLIRDGAAENELDRPAYRYHSTQNIRDRAARHGFKVDEFILGRAGTNPKRLAHILRARGIEGIILSPQSSQSLGVQFDYSPFAAVTLGYGMSNPSLHRASTNMTQGILDAAKELNRRGYQRIGLAITHWVNARANYTYSGALLHYQQDVPSLSRIPIHLFAANNLARGLDGFCRWMKEYEPDVVISFDTYIPEWCRQHLGIRIPEQVGIVVHDWAQGMKGFAGIDHRRAHVAAAAVDIVATQLLHNERGIPEVPRQVLIPPLFVPGLSIRPLAATSQRAQ